MEEGGGELKIKGIYHMEWYTLHYMNGMLYIARYSRSLYIGIVYSLHMYVHV